MLFFSFSFRRSVENLPEISLQVVIRAVLMGKLQKPCRATMGEEGSIKGAVSFEWAPFLWQGWPVAIQQEIQKKKNSNLFLEIFVRFGFEMVIQSYLSLFFFGIQS